PSTTDLSHLWDWLIYRRPFGDRGARWMYFLVRRDLVPGQKQYSTAPSTGAVASTTAPSVSAPTLASSLQATLGAGVGSTAPQGPRGLAAGKHGDVYIADPVAHKVLRFAATGRYLRSWGVAGTTAAAFSRRDSPQGLTVGPDGNVYVTDTWNQRIEVFSPSGAYLRSWGSGPIGSGPGQFFGPRGIAVAANGRVYVADTGNKRIEVFSTRGKYLSSFGTAGTGPGQFQEPSSVALSPNGTVYVADYWNRRVQAFSSSGVYLRSWPVSAWTFGSYDEPYISIGPSGSGVFVTEPQQQRVAEFTSTGQLLGVFGTSKLTTPIGVAALPHGRVAVSDPAAGHVEVFALSPPPATRSRVPVSQPGQKKPAKP
ncbi:MAG TPA: NHL repeat-containing protein, partial [Chloroflexota bacterium]